MFPAFKLDNGAVYQGQWSKGKQSGYGMMKKVDGTFLEGQWRDGQLDNGAVLYANKDIYVSKLLNIGRDPDLRRIPLPQRCCVQGRHSKPLPSRKGSGDPP